MRLSEPASLAAMLPWALGPFVAWAGLGVPAAIALALAAGVAVVAVGMRRLVAPPPADLVELHTITYSHYVEKVRWCLDRTGIAYREVPSIGILGLVLTGRTVPTLVVPALRTSIGDSPAILRFLWANWASSLPASALRFLEPTPERVALEKHFDRDLGIPVRVWSYWHLLQQPDLTLMMWGIEETSVPAWQRRILPWLRVPLAALLRRMLGVSEARAAAGLEATRAVFAEVDAMLADGRRWLEGGEEPTFVDFTFASLAALAILPPGYTGGAAVRSSPPLERFAPAWREEIERLRATEAGRFVLRVYAEERGRRAA